VVESKVVLTPYYKGVSPACYYTWHHTHSLPWCS